MTACFQYDSLLMEESAQDQEIETLQVPMLLQVGSSAATLVCSAQTQHWVCSSRGSLSSGHSEDAGGGPAECSLQSEARTTSSSLTIT